MDRRLFLKRTAAASATVPFLLNGMPLQAASPLVSRMAAMASDTDRVLVLLQLNGGNDGLNTVIPLDQYSRLTQVRPHVVLPEEKVLSVGGSMGFHPSMLAMKELVAQQKLCIVHDVGYPNPNFSHFRSTDIWTSASASDEVVTSGWLGRYLNRHHTGYPNDYPNQETPHPLAVTVGPVVSQTCQGPLVNMGMAIENLNNLAQLPDDGSHDVPDTPYGYELAFLRKTIQQTNAYHEVLQEAANAGNNLSGLYKNDRLSQQMKTVARLISGGLQTRIYVVSLGGFDTHADQVEKGDTVNGVHAQLLQSVSDAVFAFQDDLEKLGLADRVVGMTFSEFGRRIISNQSYGTDHGAAAPMFLFGTQVTPSVFGANPIIPDVVGVEDSVPMQYDFRSIYASVMMDWLGASEQEVRELVFPDFDYIPVIGGKATALPDFQKQEHFFLGQNFPNPAGATTRIPFYLKQQGQVKITVYNSAGQEVKVLLNDRLPAGEHEVVFTTQGLRPGAYVYRLQQNGYLQSKSLLLR